MYPYHNKIKQRIKNNELSGYEYVKKYKNICISGYYDIILLSSKRTRGKPPLKNPRFNGDFSLPMKRGFPTFDGSRLLNPKIEGEAKP